MSWSLRSVSVGRVHRNAPQLPGHISLLSVRHTVTDMREIRHCLWTFSRTVQTPRCIGG